MRLRVILVILLLALQGTLAFKQIGPWSDALTSSSKVNGAAASGFLRPDVIKAEMQPSATAEAPLREKERKTFWVAFKQFFYDCFILLLALLEAFADY